MTNRERILTLLSGGTPDRVPWFGDLDYWYTGAARKGSLPSEYEGDGYFALARDCGVGFYLQGIAPYTERTEGVGLRAETHGNVTTHILTTPKGELTMSAQYLPQSYTHGYVRHMLSDIRDLPAFEYMVDSLYYEPNYAETERRRALIGDNGAVLCYLPKTPFMMMNTTYSGVENFVYMLEDYPEDMERVLAKLEAKYEQAVRITVGSPAELLMIPENLSSEVVGVKNYQKYVKPCALRWTEEIRKAGKTSFIHMDGTLRGLLSVVADSGYDVIEAVTPAPVGDISLEEADRIIGDRAILWGGLPGAMFTAATPLEQFEAHVRGVLELMRKRPRYVLGIADQIPPDGELERLSLVTRLCDECGFY